MSEYWLCEYDNILRNSRRSARATKLNNRDEPAMIPSSIRMETSAGRGATTAGRYHRQRSLHSNLIYDLFSDVSAIAPAAGNPNA
jgi:hypothetical protein